MMNVMKEHLIKAAGDAAFLQDDLRFAFAHAEPVMACILLELLNQSGEIRARVDRLLEAYQAQEEMDDEKMIEILSHSEEQRRDEKRGLYPDYEDPAN